MREITDLIEKACRVFSSVSILLMDEVNISISGYSQQIFFIDSESDITEVDDAVESLVKIWEIAKKVNKPFVITAFAEILINLDYAGDIATATNIINEIKENIKSKLSSIGKVNVYDSDCGEFIVDKIYWGCSIRVKIGD